MRLQPSVRYCQTLFETLFGRFKLSVFTGINCFSLLTVSKVFCDLISLSYLIEAIFLLSRAAVLPYSQFISMIKLSVSLSYWDLFLVY